LLLKDKFEAAKIYFFLKPKTYSPQKKIKKKIKLFALTKTSFECQMRVFECQMRPRGCQIRPIECQIRPIECQIRPIECQIRPRCCQMRAFECQIRTFECLMRAFECRMRAFECLLSHTKSGYIIAAYTIMKFNFSAQCAKPLY
jgi:hypothetical protein